MTADDTDYLQATPFIDSDDAAIVAFARKAIGKAQTPKDKAIALYRAVRDSIQYDPYVDFLDPAVFRASGVLACRQGFLRREIGGARGRSARRRHPRASGLCRRAQPSHLEAAEGDGRRYVLLALVHRAENRRQMGEVHAGLRRRACASGPTLRRLSSTASTTACSIRSTRPAADTWNISKTAARSPTCRSKRSSRISKNSIRSLLAASPTAANFRDEVTT